MSSSFSTVSEGLGLGDSGSGSSTSGSVGAEFGMTTSLVLGGSPSVGSDVGFLVG